MKLNLYKRFFKESLSSNLQKGVNLYNVRTINDSGKTYLILYHGTSSANFKKIFKSGKIKVNTYFSHDMQTAKRYSQMTGAKNPVVDTMIVNSEGLIFDGAYFYTTRDMIYENGRYE